MSASLRKVVNAGNIDNLRDILLKKFVYRERNR